LEWNLLGQLKKISKTNVTVFEAAERPLERVFGSDIAG
jgi:hypothetical protein